MIESLAKEILKYGAKSKAVPVSRLLSLKQDLEDLKGTGFLNNFQTYIANDIYQFELPCTDFPIHSIIIVAAPTPASAQIIFHQNGRPIPLTVPAGYIQKEILPQRIEQYLQDILTSRGYHLKYAPNLPLKRLAVRSGLGAYGRNNICYVEGMGSFLILAAFFSDLPPEDEDWQDICQMDLCKTCQACLDHCPTQAILKNGFLINNERCLPYFNEAGGWDFPEWIDLSAHNCIVGCLRCQTICPMNAEYLNKVMEPKEFTEEETRFLFEGKPFTQFPEELQGKVKELNMVEYLGALPRNLAVLFARE